MCFFFIPPNWMVWKSGTIDVQREGWRGISRHSLDKMWSALKSQNQFPSWQLKMHHQTRWCFPWIYTLGFKMDGQMEASISYLWSAIHSYCGCLVQYGICIEGSCCTCAPRRESMTVWQYDPILSPCGLGSRREISRHKISCWRNLGGRSFQTCLTSGWCDRNRILYHERGSFQQTHYIYIYIYIHKYIYIYLHKYIYIYI